MATILPLTSMLLGLWQCTTMPGLFFETRSHQLFLSGLALIYSPPISAFQRAGIVGLYHCAGPPHLCICNLNNNHWTYNNTPQRDKIIRDYCAAK
jgi:hypothetical protein